MALVKLVCILIIDLASNPISFLELILIWTSRSPRLIWIAASAISRIGRLMALALIAEVAATSALKAI